MVRLNHLFAPLGLLFISATVSGGPLKVVCTDANLADIAKHVGGSRVRVECLIRGTDDPHQVEPRPSMVVKLASADLFVRIGMDLDMYADALLERCGNRKVQRGGPGYVDASHGIKVLEVPTSKVDPSMGDIHVYGNPHYLLDPANGLVAASKVTAGLIRVDPGGAQEYRQNLARFERRLQEAMARWKDAMKGLSGKPIVVYHKTWAYFARRFKLVEFGAIEPKPGVPPSPGHVQGLIRSMKSQNVPIVLCETFRSRRYPDMIASQTGARAVYVPIAVGGSPEAQDYFSLFDVIVSRIASAG